MQLNDLIKLLPFRLDGLKYAVPLSSVERVYRAVEITPLPKAPTIVLGVVNVRGRIIPVVNIRRRFGLPDREMTPNDQLIVARTTCLRLALLADCVEGVIEISEHEIIEAGRILPAAEYVEGVAKLADGLILIHDIDRFLSLEEEDALMRALPENQ